MKRLIIGATIGALTLGAVMAQPPVVEEKTQEDNANYQHVPLTGSHLKQKVKKRNIIAVGRTNNVLVIDQKEMQRNGNGDLRNQLNRYPGVQVNGH